MNPIKKIVLFIAMLPAPGFFAQQNPGYSMYMYDKMLINPAFTGSSNWAVATLKNRTQFIGLKGNPVTQTFNFHAPIQKKHIGLGFKVVNDKIAVMSNLNMAMDLSYHLNFAGGKLSFGLEAGFMKRQIDYNKLIMSSQHDNVIPLTSVSSVVPDASLGMYYHKKQFYAGLSQYHILKVNFNDKTEVKSQSRLYGSTFLLIGRVFELSKKWTLEPSMLLKQQSASPAQLDINFSTYYNDKIGAGLQYRTGDAIALTLRVNITEGLRIAYAYDITVSKLSPYSKGSHEIMISYGIKLPPPAKQKEIHPRYYF
ncbi:MAG: type IX secretion system membrane protein PorP/SprF [Bacteroidota bacterium]